MPQTLEQQLEPIYEITAKGGGIVGSVRSIVDAFELMVSLRKSFPQKHYFCRAHGYVMLDSERF